jgi:hypothetical protein
MAGRSIQLGKHGNERGESLETRCVKGLCVCLLLANRCQGQFLCSQEANERVVPTHRKVYASMFMVSLSLTGKQSGVGLVTGLPSFFAQLPSQKEMVGWSQPLDLHHEVCGGGKSALQPSN